MIKYKERGIDSFYQRDFKNALFNFSLALREAPEDKEVRMCAILADLALEKEEEAMALFEYYTMSRSEENADSEAILEEIIDSLDVGLEKLASLFESQSVEDRLQEENGITYEDFITLIHERGDFRKAFEDIMFSTKVLISKKEDFIDFLELLIDNGFTEMSLSYLESAVSMFPGDDRLQILFQKAQEQQHN